MKLNTFYKIYYRHRFQKASFILKIYLSFSIVVKYLINLFYMQKTIDVDSLALKKNHFFKKDLNFLFEYFNSDKGESYINQYTQPYKRKNSKIIMI